MKRLQIKPWQIIVLCLLVLGLYLFLPKVKELRGTFSVIRGASILWIGLGLVATVLTFLAAAFTQMAAGNGIGSFSKILQLQLAGNFLNHFLPFNLGSISLTADYYKQLGKKSAQALTIVAMPAVFGVITSVLLVLILSPITILHVINNFRHVKFNSLLVYLTIALLIIGILAFPVFKQKARSYITEAKQALKAVRNLRSYLALSLGSIAISLFSSAVLFASVKAVHQTLSPVDAFVFYLTSSVVGDFVPTPGGVGGTEAVLVLELSSIGMGLTSAVAATLLYRLVSFWVPMIPGAFAAYKNAVSHPAPPKNVNAS